MEDELPTRMGQREQEHIGGAVDVQVVDDGVDALDLRRDPGLHLAEEVDPVHDGAPAIRRGERLTRGRLEGAEDVPFPAAAIVDLLGGSLGRRSASVVTARTSCWPGKLLADSGPI